MRSPGMGIKVGKPKLDLAAMMKFKDEGVDGNVKGVAFLFKKNKIETFEGVGRIAAPGKVEVKAADGKTQTLETKAIVIATGSDVAPPAGHRRSTRSASCRRPARWCSTRCRSKLLVIGAGVIGLELGSVWRRLGAQVTGGRVPRPHPARHGRRGLPPVPAHPREAGHRLQAVVQGHGGRHVGQDAQGDRRAGGRRRGRDGRGRCGAGRGRPRALHGGARARSGRRQEGRQAAASSSMRISRPTCRASTPSAT